MSKNINNKKVAKMVKKLANKSRVPKLQRATRRGAIAGPKRKAKRRVNALRRGGSKGGLHIAKGGRASIARSLVSDGVNVGSVWKNSLEVRETFHRFEKFADLNVATTAFAVLKQMYVNPGNSVLHPVFSQQAAVYEKYICNYFRVHIRTEEYMATNNVTSSGMIVVAASMDVDDSNFGDVSQMENYSGAISGPPFAGTFVYDMADTHRKKGRNSQGGKEMALNEYFVFSSGNSEAPTGLPGKFYDIGNLQIIANGCQAATPAAEVWLEYSYTMIDLKQQTPQGQSLLQAHIVESPAATAAASGSSFLGTTGGILRAGSTLPTVLGKATFTLPTVGTFLVAAVFSGSVTVVPTFGLGTSIVAVSIFEDNSSGATNGPSAVSSSTAVLTVVYNVTIAGIGAPNTVTITGLTNLAAGTADIFISQISTGLLLGPRSVKSDESRFERIERMLAQLTSSNEFDLVRPSILSRLAVHQSDDDDDFKETMLSRSTVIGLVDDVLKKSNSTKK